MILRDYINMLNTLVEAYPSSAGMTVISADDEEGNGYTKVNNHPSIVQIHNLKTHNLEIVGYYTDESININDCNAVCVN